MIAPETQSIELRGFQPDQLEELVSNSRLEHYVLAACDCSTFHRRWAIPDLLIDIGHQSYPVRVLGDFPPNHICIGYMTNQSSESWINGFAVDLDTVQFFPAGSEINYCAGEEAQWVTAGIDESTLQRVAVSRLGRELALPDSGVVSFPVPMIERLTLDSHLTRLIDDPKPTPEKVDAFLLRVAELLTHLREGSIDTLQRRWRHREHLLHQAEEYLRANSKKPFDVSRLASYVGITPRSIQRHFLDAYGLTPLRWARCYSLHNARTRLLQADPRQLTVEGIAYECGFRHMGRFAHYYQELFGELPSETLVEKSAANTNGRILLG